MPEIADLMVWVFAVLIVLAMGGVAMLAAGHGEPMKPVYDDRPDALVPADRPLAAQDLRAVRFPLALRGYRMADVDALLARLAAEAESRGGVPTDSQGATATAVEPGADPVAGEQVPEATLLAEEWAGDQPAGADILDFSTESVDYVESLLDQWSRKADRPTAEENPALTGAGAYVGEVLVRAVPGARWGRHAALGDEPVVVMPSGRLENPIGKARNRYEGDESDSIAFFLLAAIAGEQRAG